MNYCCEDMKYYIELGCTEHNSKYDCPDCIIDYSTAFDEYTIIIHDGGKSGIQFNYCPWCGQKLGPSKRELWFTVLEYLGFDDPLDSKIPEEFNDESWYNSGKYKALIDLDINKNT